IGLEPMAPRWATVHLLSHEPLHITRRTRARSHALKIAGARPAPTSSRIAQQSLRETGHAGFATEAGVVYVTVDPGHAALRVNADLSLERMLAHALHHSARWDGPGYGRTLGAALVSEGLAGHFAQEVFGKGPEPWESLPVSVLRTHIPRAFHEWAYEGYAHEAWFFGSPDFPRWLGYSLGYQLVARYLASHPGVRASELVHGDARDFLPQLGEV
ncbi:DUF2268 domain-containing putative Zn-dependent protease, partial [Paenirhodobacter populi]